MEENISVKYMLYVKPYKPNKNKFLILWNKWKFCYELLLQ